MLHSTSALNYQWIISEPVGIMWVICNKHSRTSGPCVTTMRWILKHNTNSWPAIYLSRPSFSLGNKKQVHLLTWVEDEWSWWGRTAERKHCWTNATGTTTDTINKAVVPLTMSLAWHSSRVWCCWKKGQWCSLSLVLKSYSQGLQAKSSEDLTGPSAGEGSILWFKVVSHWSCYKCLLIRPSMAETVFTVSKGK